MAGLDLDPYKEFSTLSFKDLVEARDLYHRQLMRKENVVGTALGRYRIRKQQYSKSAAKTLTNSEVRNYSWPCILVLVKEWIPSSQFGSKVDPANFIPPSLEMPDGRVIPFCVVEARPDMSEAVEPVNTKFPSNWIGGGYPVIADVQGQEHIASIGGMMTDGHLMYALTNRHVTGAPGETVHSILDGERVAIGRSSRKQITRLPFQDVYPMWPGKDVFVQMDIGLIEVDDLSHWTAQVYGMGTVGHMVDLNTDNISLRLLDCPLEGYGCATGRMNGKILGMFYRYKSTSGSEYVSDFLIGPDADKPFSTHHGDSGTLWLLRDPKQGLLPLAVQWGGQTLTTDRGSKRQPYAMATGLSTVCRLLDVDFVRDLNTGHPEYWGAVGHYTIAEKACEIVKDSALKSLMQANLTSITYPVTEINQKTMKGLSTKDFVPLADVPDMVWKVGRYKRGGMTSPEHANHFADMDKTDSNNETLLDICAKSDKNIDPAVWMKYYNDPAVNDKSRGLLPFRCWQIYNEMVDAVKAGNATRFVCAAGILSHYVGDACQPLHISYMFNGDPDQTEVVEVKNKKTGEMRQVTQPVAKGVHGAYEDGLVNFHAPDILAKLQKVFAGKNHGMTLNTAGGFGAAKALVQLMQQTFNDIQPKAVVDAFVPVRKQKPKEIAEKLWDEFGDATVQVMTAGTRTLSMLWDSAWTEGGGTAKLASKGEIDPAAFKKLYIQPDFLPSMPIEKIANVLNVNTSPTKRRTRASDHTTARRKLPAVKHAAR